MDVDISRVDGLLDVRRRILDTASAGQAVVHGVLNVLESLCEAVDAEVARREAVLRECRRDPEADCSGPDRRYQDALRERTTIRRVHAESTSALGGIRRGYDAAGQRGASMLDRLHGHLKATPTTAAAVLAASALAGVAAGHVPGPGGGSSSGAIRDYSVSGASLNRNLWDHAKGGTPLSDAAVDWCRRLDDAFAASPPIGDGIVLTHSASEDILEDLKASRDDIPERIAGRLSLGFMCRHHGYLSASDADPYALADSRRVHMIVHVPPGTHVLDLRATDEGGTGLSAESWEHEILLPREGYLRMWPAGVKAKRVGGVLHWYVHADFVPPE